MKSSIKKDNETILGLTSLAALAITVWMMASSLTRPAPAFASVGRKYPAPAKASFKPEAEPRKNSIEFLLGNPADRLQVELKRIRLQIAVDKRRATEEKERQRRRKIASIAPKQASQQLDAFILAEERFGVHCQTLYVQWQKESTKGSNTGNCNPDDVLAGEKLKAYEEICRRLGIDPQSRRVSETGDMGPYQFQPETWLIYGIDGDGDGQADPWNFQDAIMSSASFLAKLDYSNSPWKALAKYNGGSNFHGSERARRYADVILRGIVR